MKLNQMDTKLNLNHNINNNANHANSSNANNINIANLASMASNLGANFNLANLGNLANLNLANLGNPGILANLGLANLNLANLANLGNLANVSGTNNVAAVAAAAVAAAAPGQVQQQQAQVQQHALAQPQELQKQGVTYRVGDCVYFETNSTTSYQIGRIDELCRVPNSNPNNPQGEQIEIKAVVFFRRHDISGSLIQLADKYQYDDNQAAEIEQMSEKMKHLVKQRELFYSRQIETLPATSIRGKCCVQLLNESESFASYINKDDHFFYTLVYDPHQKTLLADRGEIRVGHRYQAEVVPKAIYSHTPSKSGGDPQDPRDSATLETLVYTPDENINKLTEDEINKFITLAKSVGTFARALDCTSSIKQPSLHMSAASASRDVTILYAMNLLHQNNYDLTKACCALVPSTGPVLCRDEIEEWSAAESTLFEEAMEKYGREFSDIRQDFLPWKSMKNLIEYYYMWKTTDRCVQQKRMKAAEAENKLKEIKIPQHPSTITGGTAGRQGSNMNGLQWSFQGQGQGGNTSGKPCESCGSNVSNRWHSWGQPAALTHIECRLCNDCWIYWKKYGGLKFVDRLGELTKRRQLTQPSLISQINSNSEGLDRKTEDLMFVASKATKKFRRSLSEEQYKRYRRRPWVAIPLTLTKQ